jgi:hypothetical protein
LGVLVVKIGNYIFKFLFLFHSSNDNYIYYACVVVIKGM